MKKVINVHVDEKKITLEVETTSGYDLKQAAGIPQDVRLVLEVPNGADLEVLNNETYTLKSGMVFFSDIYKRIIKIEIDSKEYSLDKADVLGSFLMDLASLDRSKYKLLKDSPGADLEIEDNTMYHLENKDEFFSVKRDIQNGNGGINHGITSER
jgi:hypothetical protein